MKLLHKQQQKILHYYARQNEILVIRSHLFVTK